MAIKNTNTSPLLKEGTNITLTQSGQVITISATDSATGTVTSIATSAPITGGIITTSGTIGITQASGSSDGYLSSGDWTTFNNKQNALTNPITGTGSSGQVAYWTGSGITGDSNFTYTNGAINLNSAAEISFNNTANTSGFDIGLLGGNSDANSYIYQRANSALIFGTNNTEAMRIFSTGNVFIGSSPSDAGYKLDVNGTARIQTIANATTDTDRFLVSDSGVIKYRTGAQLLSDIGAGGLGGSTGSVDNAILRADGTGGSTVQSSAVVIDDLANLTLGLTSTSDTNRFLYTQGSGTNINLLVRPKGNGGISLVSNSSSSTNTSSLSISQSVISAYAYDTDVNNNTKFQLFYNRFYVLIQDSSTNTVKHSFDVGRSTNNTPSNGIGSGLRFLTQTTNVNYTYGSTIESISTDVTNGSEDFDLVFKTMAAGATASERLRILSTGQIKLSNYTSTSSFTGTAAGILAFDSSGNVLSKTGITTGVASATFTANSGTTVNDASTFDGYTLAQVVKALRNVGILD